MPLDPKLCPMLSAGRQGGIHSFNFWKSALTMACVGTHVAVDAARLWLPHVHCDERYAASVTCAGRQFFFTRREVGNDLWETLARIGTPGAITAVRSPDFSPPLVTLPHTAKVSHNAAFLCIANRTLVAYGGQAFRNSSHERGVMRLAAKATQWPLSWGRPRLVLSGEPEHSSCVEERPIEPWLPWSARPAAGFTCEFDGKLGAVQHGGKVFVFSRANRYRDLGGRHVQVAISSDDRKGVSFGRFSQVRPHASRPIAARSRVVPCVHRGPTLS